MNRSKAACALVDAGALIGAAAVLALCVTLPAATRAASIADPRVGLVRIWIALAGLTVLPMAVASGVLRGALSGARVFRAADDASAARVRLAALALWTLSAFAVLVVLGAFLRTHTHNHALAGVTFAMLALGALTLFGAIIARLASIARAHAPARAVLSILIATVGAADVAALVKLAHGTALASALDVLTIGVGLVLALKLHRRLRTELVRVALPAATVLLVCGIVLAQRNPALADSAKKLAPVFAPLLELCRPG